MTHQPEFVKVVFDCEVEDGWPPVSAEGVWTRPLGHGRYRVANVPFFVPDLAVGDIVDATSHTPGEHPRAHRLVEDSDHCTIRLIIFRDGPLRGDLRSAADRFHGCGVGTESAEQFGLVALDIPPTANLRQVRLIVAAGAADGSWDYEESRVTGPWAGLDREFGH